MRNTGDLSWAPVVDVVAFVDFANYLVYIPDSYDGTKEYALYVTLPGYQGLYFQGVGENIRTEDFGFEAQKYNSEIIIVAPQLNDWGETSADQAIELT